MAVVAVDSRSRDRVDIAAVVVDVGVRRKSRGIVVVDAAEEGSRPSRSNRRTLRSADTRTALPVHHPSYHHLSHHPSPPDSERNST